VQISVIANSLSDFTITLGGAAVIAAPAAPAKPAAAPAPAEPDTSRRSRRAERNNDTDADTGSMAAAPVLPAAGSTPAAPQKRQRPSGPPTIETALLFASDVMIENLEPDTTIAVVSIASRDIDAAEFVLDELAYIFVNTGNFKVVDRKSLEAIQSEQNFQTSGEVDDSSAVSIGKLLGANIVITGSVSGSGSTRRLRLKALDVKTAEIIAMASEAF
jgi:TolB-like protein